MADVVPLQGLHDVRGFTCDLCAELCDPEAHELNALDCTFPNCPKSCSVYHQDCLEKYLKSIRLEKYATCQNNNVTLIEAFAERWSET